MPHQRKRRYTIPSQLTLLRWVPSLPPVSHIPCGGPEQGVTNVEVVHPQPAESRGFHIGSPFLPRLNRGWEVRNERTSITEMKTNGVPCHGTVSRSETEATRQRHSLDTLGRRRAAGLGNFHVLRSSCATSMGIDLGLLRSCGLSQSRENVSRLPDNSHTPRRDEIDIARLLQLQNKDGLFSSHTSNETP